MRDYSLKPLALIVVLVATASALVMIAPASDAETYDGTIDLYGYKITMGLIEPNQVSSVEWDFGDGSEKVTVQITSDNPVGTVQHIYSEKGDYVVTATMRNKYTNSEGQLVDGESKLTYLYHIYGYPIVTFDSKGGSAVAQIEGTKSHYVPEKPADPTRTGFGFTGWYTDPACTQRFSPLVPVLSDTVVYAGWESTGSSGSIDVSGHIVTYNVADGLEYKVTGTGTNAISFTVSVKKGYRFDTGSITASVGVDGITPVNGVYTLAGISKDTVIDITGDRLYAVSYDLKNVSLSSEDLERDSLKASFSPTFGWSGMDIRVIMGGADVTSEYVDGSAVSIPELTEDVIIIAQADMPWIYIAIGAIVIIAILAGALLIRRRGA